MQNLDIVNTIEKNSILNKLTNPEKFFENEEQQVYQFLKYVWNNKDFTKFENEEDFIVKVKILLEDLKNWVNDFSKEKIEWLLVWKKIEFYEFLEKVCERLSKEIFYKSQINTDETSVKIESIISK